MRFKTKEYVDAEGHDWYAWIEDDASGFFIGSDYHRTEAAARRDLKRRVDSLVRRLSRVKI